MTYSRVLPITEGTAIDRLNTLCRGSALYPHHEIHGLVIPFGWTNDILTKPSHCPDTLPATPTNSLSMLSPGWPHAYQRHQRPPSWQKRSQTGTRYRNNKRAHKVMSAYRARVPHAHNLPSFEVPTRGTTRDRTKTTRKGKCG